MATLLFANNARSTLAGAITNTSLTANLAAGTGVLFPNPGAGQYFCLSFVDAATGLLTEITHVTNVTGDTVTMVRAQEGTTALNWLAGDLAMNLWTAGSAATMIQESQLQIQSENFADDIGSANAMAITLTPAPFSLASITGSPIRIKKSASPNTTAVTLAVNGLAVTPVIFPNSNAMASGELPASGILTVIYDGANFQVQSLILVPPPGANLVALTTPGSNNFTAPLSTWYTIEGWGGGGGSMSSTSGNAVAGAGSGAYFKNVEFHAAGAVIPYTIGAAGIATTTPTRGGTGGATTWNSSITAGGGAGSNAAAIGSGGTASGGDVNLVGSDGIPFSSPTTSGGTGGAAPWGSGGGATGSGAADPGNQPGGGAGGPGGGGTETGQPGGAGAIFIAY